jgi:hypothetical protein
MKKTIIALLMASSLTQLYANNMVQITGMTMGGKLGVTSELFNRTGMDAQFNIGYNVATTKTLAFGVITGIGVTPYYNKLYNFNIPLLINANILLNSSFNVGWDFGVTAIQSFANIDHVSNNFSIAPTLGFKLGYKPSLHYNIQLGYTEQFQTEIGNDKKNIGELSLGVTYTFGESDDSLDSQYNVTNQLPWYQ